jgi:hypothetical protein
MNIQCQACGITTELKQAQPYHAGFSSLGFLYCDSSSAIVEFNPYNLKYMAVVGDKHPWALSSEEKSRLEAALKPSPTGGRFRFGAMPRCPKCQAILPDLLNDDIHFVEIGLVIDADKEDAWTSDAPTLDSPPSTPRG